MKNVRAALCIVDSARADFLPPDVFNELTTLLPDLLEVPLGEAWNKDPGFFERLRPEILITGWGAPRLPAMRDVMQSVQYVCHLAGTTRSLVDISLLKEGLLVTNWGTCHAATVAECALMLILASLRRLTKTSLQMHVEKRWLWPSDVRPASLYGRKVGIHGFGAVARSLIPLLRPFGVEMTAYSHGVPDHLFAEWGVRQASTLDELFASSNVLVEVEAASPANLGSVTEKHLRLLGEDAVFVNVGRAAVVEEAGLLLVAQEGRLQMGLDVFHLEPLPQDSILRGLPNVCLLAHQAGPTPDRQSDCGRFALENIRAYLQGNPLQGIVTIEEAQRAT